MTTASIPVEDTWRLEDLFPDDSPNVQRAREARELLGTVSELRVLIGGATPDDHRSAALKLAERLEAHPEQIGRVDVRRDVSFFEEQALLYLPLDPCTHRQK